MIFMRKLLWDGYTRNIKEELNNRRRFCNKRMARFCHSWQYNASADIRTFAKFLINAKLHVSLAISPCYSVRNRLWKKYAWIDREISYIFSYGVFVIFPKALYSKQYILLITIDRQANATKQVKKTYEILWRQTFRMNVRRFYSSNMCQVLQLTE